MIRFLKLVFATTRIDVLDRCYFDSNPGLAGAHVKTPHWSCKSVFIRSLVFLKRTLQATVRCDRRPWFGPQGRVLFYYFSDNQLTCMAPVARHVPGAQIGYADIANQHRTDHDLDFPISLAYFAAIPFLPLVIYKWLRASGYRRRSFRRAMDRYWFTYGYHLIATWWLRRLKPAALVVANDHNTWTRTAAAVASDLGIPTIYMQHASVTKDFPPLAFDYALLDGQDALEKYTASGPDSKTEVYLIGMPKFDRYARYVNQNTTVTNAGICLNKHDPLDRVREACAALRDNLPDLKLRVRPHPSDPRVAQWISLAEQFNLDISRSPQEGPFDFLKSVDAVIAGESSILLEAALINVTPFYYDFPRDAKDWYGFARNGLAELIDDPDQLVNHIKAIVLDKPSVRARTRRYCTTVGTPFEGHSGQLAADLIRSIIKSVAPTKNQWASLHTNTPISAYVPIAYNDNPQPIILQTSPGMPAAAQTLT